MSASHHGRFVWFDLMTTDQTAAIAFYTAVMDWTSEAWGEDPANPYLMFSGPDGPVGGSMPMPEAAAKMNAPQHWIGYIGAEDVDASVAQAVKLGAKILVPTIKMDQVGRFAVVTDPFGAAFAIFQPETTREQAAFGPKIGDVSWHELMTSDLEGALAFYGELFGWVKTSSMDMGPMGTYQMYGPDAETSYGGMMKATPEMPATGWLYYTTVADLEASAAAATANGGAVINGPMEVPGGSRIVIARDPQGCVFALHATA
jgi:hypothetical protein